MDIEESVNFAEIGRHANGTKRTQGSRLSIVAAHDKRTSRKDVQRDEHVITYTEMNGLSNDASGAKKIPKR